MTYIKYLTLIAILLAGILFLMEQGTEEAYPEEAYSFGDLLDAIEWVESKGDANARGDKIYLSTFLDFSENFEYSKKNPNNVFVEVGSDGEYTYQAIGAYQIHKIYVNDVNRILRLLKYNSIYSPALHYTYEDRWDKWKSRQMVTIYLSYYGEDKSLLEKAALHCAGPDGYKQMNEPRIKAYLEKIKARLERRKNDTTDSGT